MTTYGSAVLTALERGPMTASEIAFDADISLGVVRQYINYHQQCRPPKIHVAGAETSEKTLRVVAIYALGPAKGMGE